MSWKGDLFKTSSDLDGFVRVISQKERTESTVSLNDLFMPSSALSRNWGTCLTVGCFLPHIEDRSWPIRYLPVSLRRLLQTRSWRKRALGSGDVRFAASCYTGGHLFRGLCMYLLVRKNLPYRSKEILHRSVLLKAYMKHVIKRVVNIGLVHITH